MRDIVEIVPTDILTDNKDFFGYIHESNTRYSLKKAVKNITHLILFQYW